jgi:predicted RNase H-like nuclease
MLFIGLDLAWGRKNTSGGVVLSYSPADGGSRAAVLDVQETLGDDDEIVAWINRWDAEAGSEGLLLGVDAPLIVPNRTGKRLCEVELGKRFTKFQAGAHPANRTLFKDDVRGEDLVARFREFGIRDNPVLIEPRTVGVRQMMEVFPHPAHIVLFGLQRTLKYKMKPGRDYAGRWAAMNEYSRHLRELTRHDPPLDLPTDWPPSDATGRIARQLKRLEDGMDALSCAYIMYWYWWHGGVGAEVLGDTTNGYIVIPRLPEPSADQINR